MNKKIIFTLIMLIPFFVFSQKRSKKSSKNSETVIYDMMTIKGVEVPFIEFIPEEEKTDLSNDQLIEFQMKSMLQPGKFKISLDFGNMQTKESTDLMRAASRYNSMMVAVNALNAKGWEFVSSDIIANQEVIIHYYYMRKKK